MARYYDDDDNVPSSGTDKVVKIVVFAIVGMVLITSVALPLIASVGTTTEHYSNTGVRVSNVFEKYATQIATYDEDTVTLNWKPDGIYLGGEISGAFSESKIVDRETYTKSMPLIIILSNAFGWIVRYTDDTFIYSMSNMPGSAIGQNSGGLDIYPDDQVYIQDTHGDHLINDSGMYYTNISDILGFGYSAGYYLMTQGTNAKLKTDSVQWGTATVDSESIGNGYYTDNISFQGIKVDYFISIPYSDTIAEDMLEGTPIQAMIGTIPLLLIVGIIVYIARNMRSSDR